MIDSGSVFILDVRSQSEYLSGHIRNAKLIPLTELEGRLSELDMSESILVYCGSGGRSQTASQLLIDNGFTQVYNMLGGLTAWKAAGYAVYVSYSSLQEAVNGADDQSTILIGSGIYGSVVVNKTISLMGENAQTTVIDGDNLGNVVSIEADNVTISGFSVRNSGTDRNDRAGIRVVGNGSTVDGNIVADNMIGIFIDGGGSCVLRNNVIDNNFKGFSFGFGQGNDTVVNNTVTRSQWCGIEFIYPRTSSRIWHNNFINNSQQASISGAACLWDDGYEGNYWSDYTGIDLNNDGIGDAPFVIDAQNVDSFPLKNIYWNPADINHDLKVDMKDVGKAGRAFGTVPGDALWNGHADVTGSDFLVPDGRIDMRDIGMIAREFGNSYP